MDIDLIRSAEQFHNRRQRNRVWKRLVSILGCVVVFCTTYALILPAITMEKETFCGQQEHRHTDSCYTQQASKHLACTMQTIGVHTHTARCADGSCGYADFVIHEHNSSCYEGGKLVCTLPERKAHTHTAECYQIPTRVVGEHTHTDGCYTLQRGALTCGKAETEGHTHTQACYGQKQVLICTVPESDGHTHGEGCYDETGALICTEEESAGHHHGAECCQTENALTCGLEEAQPHHHTDECYAWENQLTCGLEEGPIYEQGQPELICTKEEIKPHQHTSDCFDEAGNWICGQPEILSHAHSDACFETVTEDVLTCGMEEHTHTEECYATAETAVSAESAQDADALDGTPMLMLLTGNARGTTASLPNTSITGSGTTYDAKTDTFKTNLKVQFTFEAPSEGKAVTAGTLYTYEYPAGVTIPDSLLGVQQILKDSGGQEAGTYTFVKNDDGTYSVQVVFSDDYVNGHVLVGKSVSGYVDFKGEFTKDQLQNGNFIVGEGSQTVEIPAGEITYPEDTTESYDIDVSKSGTWVQDGDKLVYTVYVRTTKGTPDPISFTDAMTIPEGLTLGTPTVEVKKYIRHVYGENSQTDDTEGTTVSVTPNTSQSGKIAMELAGLNAIPEKKHNDWDSPHTDVEFYVVTYTYPITDQTVGNVSPKNNVTVSATDSDKGQTVTDSAASTVTVTKDFSYTIGKNGAIASDKPGHIKWTVTVNNNKQNLVGAKLTDEMLGLVENASDISVDPSGGVSINRDSDGKITNISFIAGENGVNKNTYTITYYTPVEESWNGTKVTNEATLDPKPGESGDEKKATATVTVNGVQFDKSGSHNVVTDKLDWVITVNSGKLDIAGATLTDDMFAALSEGNFTIEPTSGYEFTKDDDGKITGITFQAVDGEKNTQSYTIKYSTAIPTDGTSVTNTATLTPEGEKGNPITKNPTVTVEKPSLSKSGNYSNGEINWTVTVNDNGKNIAGAVFTDSMLGQLTADQITVKYDNGHAPAAGEYTIVQGDNGKVTQITFNKIGDTDVNTNKYVVTYRTVALQEWADRIVINEARLSLNGTPVTANVTVPGSGSVAKSAGTGTVSEDRTTLTIPWTVTLNVPKGGLAAGTIIEDDVTKNEWGNTNTNQWMTTEQVNALQSVSATWSDDSGAEKGSYAFTSDTVTPVGSENAYTGFTITLDSALIPPEGATKLTFTYSTTASLANTGTGQNKFYNDVKVGEKETSAEYIYREAGVTKTDGSDNVMISQSEPYTQTQNITGELVWKVKIVSDRERNSIQVTDTLPEGVTLESVVVPNSEWNGWKGDVTLTVTEGGGLSGTAGDYSINGAYSATENTNQVTLTITGTEQSLVPAGKEIILVYHCKVDLSNENYKDGQPHDFTNNVTVTSDQDTLGSAYQTQKWTYVRPASETVSKSGQWKNDARLLTYSIVLNPDGADLVEGADTLTLTDVLKYEKTAQSWKEGVQGLKDVSVSIALDQSSVKLYDISQSDPGQKLSDEQWSWQYTSKPNENWPDEIINTITATVPDSTPLRLEYSYRVDSDVDTKNGYVFILGASNTASLAGKATSGWQTDSNTIWSEQSTTGGVSTTPFLSLTKVDAENNGTVLAGAQFSIYEYDMTTGTRGENAVVVKDTQNDGRVLIQQGDGYQYKTNTLYAVVETRAPAGYQLAQSPPTYYFYFSGTSEGETGRQPTDIAPSAIDLSRMGETIIVKNTKLPTTSITVDKVWKNPDGSAANTSGKPPVTIQLYRKSTQGSSSGGSGSGSSGAGISYQYTSNGSTIVASGTRSDLQIGSVIQITITMYYDCTYWQPVITLSGLSDQAGTWTHSSNSIYTCQATISDQSVVIDVGDSAEKFQVEVTKVSDPEGTSSGESGETPVTPEGTPYGDPVTITATDNWSHTFTNLPLTGTDESGNTVNYYYYVVETPVTNYDVSYGNNSGIQSGTITVTNKATDNPEYVLPETGGGGTARYTFGGFLLTSGAALWLFCRRKRRREAV